MEERKLPLWTKIIDLWRSRAIQNGKTEVATLDKIMELWDTQLMRVQESNLVCVPRYDPVGDKRSIRRAPYEVILTN